MLDYQRLLDVGLSASASELQQQLIEAAGAMGFGLSAGALVRGRLASRKASVQSFGNPPAGFVEASRSLDVGLQDPLLTSMLAKPGVHTYNQDFYTTAGAAELWDNQAPFGYRAGMAISLHEPSHAEVFFFGVDGPDRMPEQPAQRLALEGQLRLLALHAHEAAKRLWTPATAANLDAITPEERTALKWARDGMCVWVQGDKLLHSRPGLVGAQRSAVRKLAASGPAAVLRAIEGGLIDR